MNSPHRFLALSFVTAVGSLQAIAGTVTNTSDSGSGSLRAAVLAAVNGETIDFSPGLNGATITLTSGSLSISGRQLTIDASTLGLGIHISGNNSSRILSINSNSNVILKNLTLQNGRQISGSIEIQPENGGALLALGGQLTISNCIIKDSRASQNGGGAYFGNGIQAIVDRCSIIGNEGSGFGGGFFLIGTSSFSMSNSLIAGNYSATGGGILNLIDNPVLTNCTISGNAGSGIRNENFSAPVLRNSIVWGNRLVTGSGPEAAQQLSNSPSSTPSVDYCLVEGASTSSSFSDGDRVLWGLNNLSGSPANDPKFLSPSIASSSPSSGGDFRVFTNSPVFNIGSNTSNSTSLDRAGRPRIQDTTIDLGAFESGYVTFPFLHPSLGPTGDQNNNGLSNFLEYAMGIDPAAPDDPSVRPALTTSGGFHFLTTSQRINAADAYPFWETSTSLESLSWSKILQGLNYVIESTSIPSPGRQQLVFKLLDTDSRRFYRQAFSNTN